MERKAHNYTSEYKNWRFSIRESDDGTRFYVDIYYKDNSCSMYVFTGSKTAENLELREDNERLENKINSPKNIGKLIENCAILSFFCLMCAGLLCIWFMMITDAIMGFKFVVFL